ncbi:MAG: hypothetical protein JXB50_11335, partial [Spirochaetes bacterium]|nr:hypothetical protein [Spirochaetota bacterium]
LYLSLNDKYEIVNITDEPPQGNVLYIKGKYSSDSGGSFDVGMSSKEHIKVDFLFDKYYMQEDLAPKAESYLRQKNTPDIELELSVDKEGNSRIKNLLVNGKRIEDVVQ